jgi:formylglycine-generating enzyme required for sulfatase activity
MSSTKYCVLLLSLAYISCSDVATEPDTSVSSQIDSLSSEVSSSDGQSNQTDVSSVAELLSSGGANVNSSALEVVSSQTEDISSGLVSSANQSSTVLVSSSSSVAEELSSSVPVSSAIVNTHLMKLIPAGTFPYGKLDDANIDTPRAGVNTAVASFYIDSTHVTQQEYFDLLGLKPSKTDDGPYDCPTCPVTDVTAWDMLIFANARSKRDGLDTVYTYTSFTRDSEGYIRGRPADFARDPSKNGYRLASAIEHEYALRAGTTTDFFWGTTADSEAGKAYVVLYDISDPDFTKWLYNPQPVASKLPNPWGLYDMVGNVSTEMWASATTNEVSTNASMKSFYPDSFRASYSPSVSPNTSSFFGGIRLLRNAP